MKDGYFYRKLINICSSDELGEIYNESLSLITQVTNVDLAGIYIVDKSGNNAVLEAYTNLDEKFVESAKIIPRGDGITWDIILNPKIIILSDMQEREGISNIARNLGIRSAIGMPVRTEGKCIGVIWILSFKEDVFDDEKSLLLRSLGELIASSISRIKRREELKRKNTQLSILSQISIYFNEITNLDEILRILDHLINQIEMVDAKAIYLFKDINDNKIAKLEAHTGMPDEFLESFSSIEDPKGITWECINNQDLVYYPEEKIKNYEFSSLAQKVGITSMISIPIKLNQRTVGACNFISFARSNYTHDEIEFIKAFGSQIGSTLVKIKMQDKMKRISVTDQLTGLYNSGYFHESLDKYVYACKRNSSRLSLIVIDLDEFKNINDTYGHLAGDKVISEVGRYLGMNIRKMDVAARYGGDEFVIILPETGSDLSKKIAKRLYKRLTDLKIDTSDRRIINPGISIGIATFDKSMNSSRELIQKADQAMYINKRSKKSVFLHSEEIA